MIGSAYSLRQGEPIGDRGFKFVSASYDDQGNIAGIVVQSPGGNLLSARKY